MSQFSILRFSFLIKLQAETCNFIKKQALTQVFSSEFCGMFRNTFFVENLWWLILTHIPQHLPLKYHMILQTHSFGTISKKVLSYLISSSDCKLYNSTVPWRGTWHFYFLLHQKKIKKNTWNSWSKENSWVMNLNLFLFLMQKKRIP